MPSTGFYLFLPKFFGDRTVEYNVSMPSTGFYLFLRSLSACTGKGRETVSMPSTGFYLFLRNKGNGRADQKGSVSMPSTGFYLFLLGNGNVISTYEDGVNALNGLLLISSKKPRELVEQLKPCQCPQRASTYFF